MIMKQVHTIGLPGGFSAAGTYSGLCDSRVKPDLAVIASRTDCAIVIADPCGASLREGKVLLLHNGTALPGGDRGREITSQVCAAAAQRFGVDAGDVAFLASGVQGRYFRPSLAVNSLGTLRASLEAGCAGQVGAVIDNLGDMSDCCIPIGSASCRMSGMAADGTDEKPGLCIIATDAAATPQQMADAVKACAAYINMEGFTVVAMANGAAGEGAGAALLAQAMKDVMEQLGFQPALQACS